MEKRTGSLLLCKDYCHAGIGGITLRVLPTTKIIIRIFTVYIDSKPQTNKLALKRHYHFGTNLV